LFSITKDKNAKEENKHNGDLFLLNREGRYTALEGLRGIAVWMVFGVHFFAYYDKPLYLSQSSPMLAAIIRFLHLGHIGVDLFFVLSGFFIAISLTKKEADYSDFMVKRFYRLLPAHIAVLLFLIFKNRIFDPYIILTNVFFVNIFLSDSQVINVVAWSLGYEVVFYTLYGFWNIKLKRFEKLHSWYAFVLMFAAIWTSQWWGQPLVSAITANSIKIPDMSRFIGFLFGIGLAKLYRGNKLPTKLVNALLVPAVFAVVLLQWNFEWGRFHKAVYFLLVGGSFSIIIASILGRNKLLSLMLNSKLLRFTGVISYSFYLIHPITLGLTLALGKYMNINLNITIHLVLAFIATYLAATALFLLTERPYFAGNKAVGNSRH